MRAKLLHKLSGIIPYLFDYKPSYFFGTIDLFFRNTCEYTRYDLLENIELYLTSLTFVVEKRRIAQSNESNIPWVTWFIIDIQLIVLVFPQEASPGLVYGMSGVIKLGAQYLQRKSTHALIISVTNMYKG